MDTLILQGRRWGSIGAFVLTAPCGALALLAALQTGFVRDVWEASVIVVLGSFMLLYGVDALLKAVRPNRLTLTLTGLTLETVYGAKTWTWDQYAGLTMTHNRVLTMRETQGKKRRVGIGHWRPDLGRVIADYARRAGREVPPGSDEVIMVSPVWFLVPAGLLGLVGLAIALH